jgi:hypothetical protein
VAKRLLNSSKEPHRLLEDFVKKIQSLTFLATLVVAIGMVSWGTALTAQSTSTPTDQQTQQPDTTSPQSTPDTTPQQPAPENPPAAQQPPSSQAPSASDSDATGTATQTFSGTVVKQGSKYVLKDDSGKVYDIDHQTDVAKFEGKRVRVQGSLDANGKIVVK